MYFSSKPIKLVPARKHGAGCELFIVEGDSAASMVTALRDSEFQAVLPMQGKPMNALKTRHDKVIQYPLFKAVSDSLGFDLSTSNISFASQSLHYERIILLFDPDADGIHCGALMLMFFYRYLRPLLDAGKVEMVHPPWMQVYRTGESPMYTFSEAQSVSLINQLRTQGQKPQTVRYRGLAGIDREVLMQTCLAPATRNSRIMSATDALMAIDIFGGGLNDRI